MPIGGGKRVEPPVPLPRVVRSNVLVYRGRCDRHEHDLVSAERHDVLRRTDDGYRLARRLVVLDSTSLPEAFSELLEAPHGPEG